MRFLRLSEEEKPEPEKLYKTSSSSVVHTRSLSLLYSNEQRSIKEVSELMCLMHGSTKTIRYSSLVENPVD